MARLSNQKLKALYILQILLENTDDASENVDGISHGITADEIISQLKNYGIPAERKSVYDDIKKLNGLFGMEIFSESIGHNVYYHVGSRPYGFQLVELKLLIDSVQCNKFISKDKSKVLIEKIEKIASKNQRVFLKRQVYMDNRVKSDTKDIYISVDKINRAISTDSQLRLRYCSWTLDKKLVPRHGAAYYYVSPWALTFDDGNYYLVAYDSKAEMIKHFRVDKMKNVELVEYSTREGRELFESKDMAGYTTRTFGMFGGEDRRVSLYCENKLIGTILDRFGKDITILKTDKEHFTATVQVAVSLHFYHWVMALGDGIKIVGPQDVVDGARNEVKRLYLLYNETPDKA